MVKRILTYSLFLLLMFAFNYKTISYCFALNDTAISCFQDIDCEENESESESEKSDEKDKKADIKDYLSSYKLHFLVLNNQSSFTEDPSLLYFTSNYILGVYSPPEQPVI